MIKNIIIHYSEIGLKGKNRIFFEKKLIDNIRKRLAGYKSLEIKNIFGRFLISLDLKKIESKKNVEKILKKIPGIKNFSWADTCIPNLKKISQLAVDILQKSDFTTFKVSARRATKEFRYNSQQINAIVGEAVLKQMKNKRVDLSHPQITIYIELVNQYAFLYTKKQPGIGGLPVGTSGRVLSLISSGIDSPVASLRMMKRGAEVVFVHYHSYPQTSRESINNVSELVSVLNNYQLESKVYFIPFLDFQKTVVEKANARDRVILYRRMMIRTAEAIAKIENINTLVTGESLGQVASQTLENMFVISNACKNTQVLRPLICYDKEEIIIEAKKIETYQISSRSDEDCCSLFVPQNPNTHADLAEIKKQELILDIKKQLQSIQANWEIKIIK